MRGEPYKRKNLVAFGFIRQGARGKRISGSNRQQASGGLMATFPLSSTVSGNIKASIQVSGVLSLIFKQSDRNEVIRKSMEEAGIGLVHNFWALRFTKYVTRKPFGYPKKPTGLAAKKLRGKTGNDTASAELARIWAGIKNREFFGWDPWSNDMMPVQLREKWFRENKGQYATSRGTNNIRRDERSRAYADLRRWAKKRVYEYVSNLILDDVILPLVESGKLRNSVINNTNIRATATKTRTRCIITSPREGRQNKFALHILGTLPSWEFNAFIRYLNEALDKNIKLASMGQKPRKTGVRSRRASVKPRSVGTRATPRGYYPIKAA